MPVTVPPTSSTARCSSNVEVRDAERVLLDELAARLDDVAHQTGENLIGDIGLADFDAQQGAVRRVERRFPQLLRVHLAEPLVALDRKAFAPRRQNRVEQL